MKSGKLYLESDAGGLLSHSSTSLGFYFQIQILPQNSCLSVVIDLSVHEPKCLLMM